MGGEKGLGEERVEEGGSGGEGYVKVEYSGFLGLIEEDLICRKIEKIKRAHVKLENFGARNGVEEQVEEILESFRKEYREKCRCKGYAEHLEKCQGN